MGLLDDVKNVIGQYSAGNASTEDLSAQFHQVVGTANPSAVSQGIAAMLGSNGTQPFGQMVSQLFANGSADQKTGMLNAMLANATPEIRAKLGSLIPAAAATGAVSGVQATSISADAVSALAQQVHSQNPGIVQEMGSFYSQHPTLVKTLGSAAMVLAMRKIAEHHS
jgi:hypothetical protein